MLKIKTEIFVKEKIINSTGNTIRVDFKELCFQLSIASGIGQVPSLGLRVESSRAFN